MKKLTLVLFVLLLSFSVFAGLNAKFTGSATASYTYDLDEKSFNYSAPTVADIITTFTYDPTTVKITAADGLRAELTAALKFTASHKTAGYYGVATNDRTLGSIGKFSFSISAFNVKYKKLWTLNLRSAAGVGNLAKSALDYAKYKDAKGVIKKQAYNARFAYSSSKGVTFSWKNFVFAAVANGGWDPEIRDDYYLGMLSPNFKLGKKMRLQVAGAFNHYEYKNTKADISKWLFTGSLKFAVNATKLKLTFATDHDLTVDIRPDQKITYNVDGSLTASIGPKANFVTLDAYYGRVSKVVKQSTIKANTINNLLSGRVNFNFKAFEAPLVVTVSGLNVLNTARILDAEVAVTIADKHIIKAFGYDLLTTKTYLPKVIDDQYFYYNGNGQYMGLETTLVFGPVAINGNVYTRLAFNKIGFGSGATYTNEYFVANAKVNVEFDTTIPANDGLVKVEAGVESEGKVIENATVSLKYEGNNLLRAIPAYVSIPLFDHDDVEPGLGKVTAAVKVVF